MLKKIDKIFIILMTIFLVINILAIGFIFVNSLSAAESDYTCVLKEGTTDSYQCPPEGRTRVQVAIPGLTETCTYKTWELDENGEPQDVPAPCYSAASLPDFVRRVYTFSIGLIAVIAVFMIMIAGLTLIFAAGNASAIERAKSRITVSILGVVLALLSYVILDTLNPRLTNLSLPGVTPIDTIEQSGIWCSNFMKPDGSLKDDIESIENNGQKIEGNGKCDEQYEIKLKGSGGDFTGSNKCWGSECATGLTCLKLTTRPMCFDNEKLCESEKNNCDLLNRPISENPKSTCRKYKREGLIPDGACMWDTRWPSIGEVFKSNIDKKIVRMPCAIYSECSKESLCVDSPLANVKADFVCALSLEDEPKCQINNPDPNKYVQVNCDEYKSWDKKVSNFLGCAHKCWLKGRFVRRGENLLWAPTISDY